MSVKRMTWAALIGLGMAQVAWGQEWVEVEVVGEGISLDAAHRDALRKAIEQGGKVEIATHSEVKDFQLISDTIYARAEGFVREHVVLEQGPAAGGTFYCKIKAVVHRSGIASAWVEIQHVLDQIGRPGVAVAILERIDGKLQEESILESKIEERLVKAGFDVYSRRQLEAIAGKELQVALRENNMPKALALTKNFPTQIFITGAAQADAAGMSSPYGVPMAMYNCDAVAKMYYTDTGRLIASESIPSWRGGARSNVADSVQGGKQALENGGKVLVEKIHDTVMRQWATQITAGGEIVLEVEGLSALNAIHVKKALSDIDKVDAVFMSLSQGIATYKIRARLTAQTLAEHLVGPPFDAYLEIQDLQLNRLQAKAK